MCNNKFKKVMSLICATTCILSLSIPCMAADTTSPVFGSGKNSHYGPGKISQM